MAQPPAQPPAAPPPPPPGVPATRPGSVTASGIMLIILGAFAGIGGLFMLIGGAFLASGDFGEQFGGGLGDVLSAAGGVVVVLGLLVIAYAVFKIIAGAKVLALRNGWRITGIVLCGVAIVGWLISLVGSFQGTDETTIDPATFELTTTSAGASIGGIILSLVFLAANTVTLILLARSGSAFRRT